MWRGAWEEGDYREGLQNGLRKVLEGSDKNVHYFDFSDGLTSIYTYVKNDQTTYYKYMQFMLLYPIKAVLKIDQCNLSH